MPGDKKHPRKTVKKKIKKAKSKYDEKIVVDASFEDLMKELIKPKSK